MYLQVSYLADKESESIPWQHMLACAKKPQMTSIEKRKDLL